VSNAIKHGKATDVTILLEEAENELRLVITDNGQGMAPASKDRGLGLRIMADRAKMVGGTFQVKTAPTRGIELICLVPQMAANG
jgi:signal transduction histidine kinase